MKVIDELLPKATGREAVVEKRQAQNEFRRARADSPGEISTRLADHYPCMVSHSVRYNIR